MQRTMQTRQEKIAEVEAQILALDRDIRMPLHDKNRRKDELLEKWRKLKEPPYHRLIVGEGSRTAYDADGVPVDEETGLPVVPDAETAVLIDRPARPKRRR